MHKNIIKFLLVEDEPIAQIIGKFVIEKAGYQLDIVNSPQKAMSILKKQKYDLIFMDLGLPGVSGIEFTNKLIKQLKINTPIIAITAFNPDSKKAECIENGFQGFIEKPFTNKQLEYITNQFFPSNVDR
jgi:CheY-like chemotaxis protein